MVQNKGIVAIITILSIFVTLANTIFIIVTTEKRQQNMNEKAKDIDTAICYISIIVTIVLSMIQATLVYSLCNSV